MGEGDGMSKEASTSILPFQEQKVKGLVKSTYLAGCQWFMPVILAIQGN
jgi:hypothetical protein